MNFKIKCKVCGEELNENTNLLKHIVKHPPIAFFDVLPDMAWSKKKEPEPEVEEEVEEIDEED